ncbi:hypothetical protein N9B82_00620 [Saprospiraceae bacterium]|nr:hypothetical protein [Saprospiraceae bacterium]
MKNLILIITFISFAFSTAFSQDIIELKSGETLKVKITKIGMEEIEFRSYGSKDDAVIKVDKFLVKAYKFENSDSMTSTIAEKLTTIEVEKLYSSKTHYAIKTQPLALIYGSYRLSYEQSLSFNQSFEAELGINKPNGVLFDSDTPVTFNTSFRYKFFYRPTSAKLTDTGKNPLSGLYIAPVASFGNSIANTSIFNFGDPLETTYNYYGALMIDLGYQVTIQNAIVDTFVGVGASINTENQGYSGNNSHTSFGNGAIRAGFRVGINGNK